MIRFEVAVAAPLFNTYSYLYEPLVLEKNKADVAKYFIGHRVLVPLGNRIITGYVLSIQPDEEVSYVLKKIKEFPDKTPFFHANIIPFFRWVADYYHFPIGEVISTALPSGLKSTTTKIITFYSKEKSLHVQKWPYKDIKKPSWYEKLEQQQKLSGTKTKKLLAEPGNSKTLKRLVKDKIIRIDNEVQRGAARDKLAVCYTCSQVFTVVEDIVEVSKEKLLEFSEQITNTNSQKFTFAQVKTIYYHTKLSHKYNGEVPQRELLRLYKSGSKSIKELCQKGILKKISKRVYRNPFGEIIGHYTPPLRLTSEQSDVINSIKKSLENNDNTTFLLHGVTGSGKTEVYLQAAAKTLEGGKDVLVLVPEIALATQLESHFVSRFGQRVILLHSGLSQGQRYDQWSLALSGESSIVIGARSAVFAPLINPGLIVVDEEHDAGYKQDDGLRYNARDLAVLRGKLQNCVVVLGSATPSVTSYYHCSTGKYTLLSMKKRVGKSLLPSVKIIDLRSNGKTTKRNVFHHEFIAELETNLLNNEQSIILLNRRGFSTSYICQDCGVAVQCQHCNVTLTYHKNKEQLICHYCGYWLSSKLICSNCNSDKLVPFGFGTERIEEELKEICPQATIARLDSDTAADRKKFLGILKRMHACEIDILIGTQMIAKGHHFPNVTFVGVVWADGGLNMPDFRAAERTFQILSQVTGRAGRGEKNGRVIIQTMQPDHYSIEFSRTHQYAKLYEKEIEIRKFPVFPPFVRLVCMRISGDTEFNVRKTSHRITTLCRDLCRTNDSNVEILGPVSSPLEKLNDTYRWQILLKSSELRSLHAICSHVVEKKRDLIVGASRIAVDIDPENMM